MFHICAICSYGSEYVVVGNCTVELCPGTVMTASGCAEGACSGDQLLYLTDATGKHTKVMRDS